MYIHIYIYIYIYIHIYTYMYKSEAWNLYSVYNIKLWYSCHGTKSTHIYNLTSLTRVLCKGPTHLILQVPDSVFVGELLVAGPRFGQNAALKATHVEEEVGVVFAVHRDKRVFPDHSGDGARQSVLDVPEHGPAGDKVASFTMWLSQDSRQAKGVKRGLIHHVTLTWL